MKRIAIVFAALLVMAGAFATGQAPGRYIVVFKDTVADVPGLAHSLARAQGGTAHFVYEHALKGFAATLPEPAVEALRRNPHVAYIEPDAEVRAFGAGAQTGATWGLDRVDQRARPLDGIYNYEGTGAGVTVYVIDTGIRITHAEFGGRARFGIDTRNNDIADDCNGHGTHIAATIGGATYGVAKEVSLVAVRVLGCTGGGYTSTVLAGIDWVANDHVNNPGPAVANMSFGGGSASDAVDSAVRNCIASGVAFVAAAGDGNSSGNPQDAGRFSPGRVAEAMTVGATDATDTRASWSNFGSVIDWFAPGVDITSAWWTSDTATNNLTGTSMAVPFTAGVAALYLEAHPDAAPQDVRDALYDATTKGIVQNAKSANNHLLYSLVASGAPANVPPGAGFGFSVNALTVAFSDLSRDVDGTVTAYSWDFGDGGASFEQNPIHAYAADGTYNVTLTVTDDEGATGSTTRPVTVLQNQAMTLTADRGTGNSSGTVYLFWDGTIGDTAEVFRNGEKIATVFKAEFYFDRLGRKATGAFTYQVRDAVTGVTSNIATVNF